MVRSGHDKSVALDRKDSCYPALNGWLWDLVGRLMAVRAQIGLMKKLSRAEPHQRLQQLWKSVALLQGLHQRALKSVVATSRNIPMRTLVKPSLTYAAAAPEEVAITETRDAPIA